MIDPDLGQDIVTCGFVKKLSIDEGGGVALLLELTTPACPVKETFKEEAERYVRELCETEKRIRQLESAISDLNFELEKIEVAETSGAGDRGLDMLDLDHGRVSAISTDI